MSHPGTDVPTPPQQPAAEAPAEKSGAKKWLAIGGAVVVVGVGAAYSLTGGFGIGDPKAGDCIQMTSETEFDVVDCGSDEAEAKIAGIDGQEMTSAEFDAAPAEDVCTDFATTEFAIWSGDVVTENGTIYCFEAV
jgi:hypothetical protein